MPFVPQDSLRDEFFKEDTNKNSFFKLVRGTVTSINDFRNTVEVETYSGLFLRDVETLQTKASTGSSIMQDSIDLPVVGSRVIVGFVEGKSLYPIIIGCVQGEFYRGEQSQLTRLEIENNDEETRAKERNAKKYIHQSGYWDKVDGDGNYEQFLPDGTQISISKDVEDSDDELSYSSLYTPAELSDPKTIRIKHSSGTEVIIDKNGAVTIDTREATDDSVHLLSNEIYIGSEESDQTEPIPRGTRLKTLINGLIAKVNDLGAYAIGHIHPTGVGPSGPAMTPHNIYTSYEDMTNDDLSDRAFVDKKE